jgi:hypothetical protein
MVNRAPGPQVTHSVHAAQMTRLGRKLNLMNATYQRLRGLNI